MLVRHPLYPISVERCCPLLRESFSKLRPINKLALKLIHVLHQESVALPSPNRMKSSKQGPSKEELALMTGLTSHSSFCTVSSLLRFRPAMAHANLLCSHGTQSHAAIVRAPLPPDRRRDLHLGRTGRSAPGSRG